MIRIGNLVTHVLFPLDVGIIIDIRKFNVWPYRHCTVLWSNTRIEIHDPEDLERL
jgi:hypothetical protein